MYLVLCYRKAFSGAVKMQKKINVINIFAKKGV